MKKLGIAAVTLFFLGGVLWAADFWDKADYTSWSQKDCEQMLAKSPWAFQYVHTNFYRPATNISAGPDTTTEGQASARLEPQSGERETRIIHFPVHSRLGKANPNGSCSVDAASIAQHDGSG